MLFNSNLPRGTVSSVLDFTSLDKLKHGVQNNPQSQENLRDVARQFEAMFIQLMLKQARNTSQQMPGMFDSDATRMAQSLGDEQLAMNMTDPGIGLADALMAQLNGRVANEPINLGKSGKFGNLPSSPPIEKGAVGSIEALLGLLNTAKSAEKIIGAVVQAPKHIRSFVDKMSAAAQLAASDSGVPSKLILSQAALESGWGKREITYPDGQTTHNLFGIKAGSSWQGKTVDIMTTEFVDGKAQKMVQKFRAYDSYAESFADYAKLIGTNSRYAKALSAQTAEQAAQEIQDAGYATDPEYANKLISIMSYFNTAKV